MKYDLKISLPFYKVMYSIIFMAILIIIRGISTSGEVMAALEPNIALLAGIFFADNYYKEFSSGNIQVFYRYSLQKKMSAMFRRCMIGGLYLWFLAAVACLVYMFLYHPLGYSFESNISIMINTLTVCAISILFFGILSFTITNFTQNLEMGIGIFVIIWLCLSSKFAEYLPKCLRLFLLEESHQQLGTLTPYYLSRILYLIMTVVLIFSNIYALNKEPKYKKKEWRGKYEHTN